VRGLRRSGFVGLAALAVLALGGSAGRAAAQTVVRSEVDARRVGTQDQVQLTITVEGPSLPDRVSLPTLTNLRIAGGPSTSTQMTFVNGRSSQSRSWTYLLQPIAAGNAEVGAVRAGDASAPAISIEVVAGSVKPRQPTRRSNDPFGDDPFGGFFGRGRQAEPKLMVEARPSRRSLFVGEPLLLTYYLYTQTSVTGLQFAEAPQFAGFWAEDLERKGQPPDEPTTVDGVAYHRFPVMMKLLFPTKAGRLTIPSSTLSIAIARQSVFDQGGVVQRPTQPVTVDVKPIPDEPGFSGAVGRFKATASVDRSSLAFGEAATLRFKVEGSGNLKWIDRAPEVTVPGAKVYPPQIKSSLQTTPGGIVGSRTWEFVVVPQTAGTLEIPSLAFSYFDPSARNIVRTETTPLPLRVEGGAPGATAPVPMSGPGVAARGGSLPLRADLELPSSGAFSGGAVGVVALSILVLHGVLWSGDRFERLRRRGQGRIAAPRSVRSALGELQRVGRDGMSKEKAAGVIEKTIHGVFGPVEGLDVDRARAVRELLDEVHAVRYAPQLGDYSEKLRELASRAGEVVRRWA
jgi:BatD DUF11 like domain